MPQCQRSEKNTILSADLHEMATGVWVCPGEPYSPGCPGGEIYAEVTCGRLAQRCLFTRAIECCSAEFDRLPSSSPRFWLGVRPLAVRHALDGGIDIYLSTGSNDDQLRYQCAQEVFHAVAGPDTAHWTHELLSIHFALRFLRAEGYDDYAASEEARLLSTVGLIARSALLGWQAWPKYPPVDIYGHVWILGNQLIEATSWEDVKRLTCADEAGWLKTLDNDKRRRAEAVLSRD